MTKIRLTSTEWGTDFDKVVEATYVEQTDEHTEYRIEEGSREGYYVMVYTDVVDHIERYWAGVLVDEEDTNDAVNHPAHYTSHPTGIEAIEITRHYLFSVGNAIKYLWRAGLKTEVGKEDLDKEIEDLNKAAWYINDRIAQLEKLKEERNNIDS